jgi:S1-C subfamily serine protease
MTGLTLAAQAAEPTPAAPIRVSESETVTFSTLSIPDREHFGVVYQVSGDYREQVIRTLEETGYDTRGGENIALGEDTGSEARFVLSGVMTDGVCTQHTTTWSSCWVEVTWQLFDAQAGTIVYQQPVQGQWNGPEGKAIDMAMEGALRGLLTYSTFSETLTQSDPAQVHEELTIQSCKAPALALPKDLNGAQSKVLLVKTEDGVGTGVIVSPDGFAMTAAHVVRGQKTVQVKTLTGVEMDAEVVRLDNVKDVALLHLPGAGYPCTPIRESGAQLGEELWAIGNPMGEELSFSVTKGMVSGIRKLWESEFIQTDAPINPGYSGGPLLDPQGNLLGIISWKVAAEGFEGLSFGIPVSSLEQTLNLSFGPASDETWLPYDGGGAVTGKEDTQRFRPDEPGYTEAPPTQWSSTSSQGSASTMTWPSVGMGPRRAVLITGSALVLGTAAWASTQETTTPQAWTAMTLVNAAGWATTGIGAGWVLLGRAGGKASAQALQQAEAQPDPLVVVDADLEEDSP